MSDVSDRLRLDASAIYSAAVRAVDPSLLLSEALHDLAPLVPVSIIAVGKAADGMAAAAIRHLDRVGGQIAGGLIVTPNHDPPEGTAPDSRLVRVVGDHPTPGRRSLEAARALERMVREIGDDGEVWVLLSGGTSSLIGAPIDGMAEKRYRALMEAVSSAGLPITDLNRIRKRFAKWGAGRLARAIAAPVIRGYLISDVPGDEIAAIGSGPLSPDSTTVDEVRTMLERLPRSSDPAIREALEFLERQPVETAKPNDPAFERLAALVIGSSATAVQGAVHEAWQRGYQPIWQAEVLTGEAIATGRRIAELVITHRADQPTAFIWGGETTVTLPADHGLGGRCQELALAAAGVFEQLGSQTTVLLAAGTDGRDGPTEAAGAIVDSTTWPTMRKNGVDPEKALERHDSYPALDQAGALLRIGPTGTNVMDLVIALRT